LLVPAGGSAPVVAETLGTLKTTEPSPDETTEKINFAGSETSMVPVIIVIVVVVIL
jgi:hypothetical protein